MSLHFRLQSDEEEAEESICTAIPAGQLETSRPSRVRQSQNTHTHTHTHIYIYIYIYVYIYLSPARPPLRRAAPPWDRPASGQKGPPRDRWARLGTDESASECAAVGATRLSLHLPPPPLPFSSRARSLRVGESGPLKAVHLFRHKWPGGLVN